MNIHADVHGVTEYRIMDKDKRIQKIDKIIKNREESGPKELCKMY